MNKLAIEIINESKKFSKEYRRVLRAIKRYKKIAIFRHLMPDYDALGSQLGLYTWIKDNFPDKDVRMFGDNHVVFTPRLFPEMDSCGESWFKEPFLAIVLDVGNASRVADPRFKKAKFKIKIDHHPSEERIAKVMICDTSLAAAAELIANMLLTFKEYELSFDAARYLMIGMVGDSGSFKYSSVSSHTFAIAEELMRRGLDISEINRSMFVKQLDDLKVTAYILNNFHVSPKGVAYYVLSKEIQEELKITTERGKENVNLFANIDGINAWASITEDPKDNCWRVSLRSKQIPISSVAEMFEGGGHAQASGCKLNTLDDLPRLIEELDKLF